MTEEKVPFLIRPGQLIRVPRLAVKGTCRSYSLLYRVNEVRDKWFVRVTRLDQHAPKNPHTSLSMQWLWRGRVVGHQEVPSQLEWDDSLKSTYAWAKTYNLDYAAEMERKYG